MKFKRYYFFTVIVLPALLQAYIVSLTNKEIIDSPIVVAGQSQGIEWCEELQYLTYVLMNDDGHLFFRTYPFTTIDTPGAYRLANNVSSAITISVSNVTLDMHGHTVSGGTNGIVINSGLNNITIKNGIINSVTLDGVQVNAECQDITLKDITVKNGLRGINFTQVTNGLIRNCDMNLNTTGLELDASHNIMIENCTANANIQSGFCLLSSTTCSLIDCKAISTGDGNTNAFDNNIFGFVAANGFGNLFERCIANSTQALSTTDSNSLIAGFAFRGSEGCSKIIDSEAANSQTNPDGFTIPFGILLEATLGSEITLTAVPPVPIPGSSVISVDWSPDGKYIAAGINLTSDNLFVYQFDRLDFVLSRVATPDVSPGGNVRSVNWSPDGKYVAVGINDVGDTQRIRIYSFDPANNSLTQVATPNVIPGDSVQSVNWSFDGKYLAVGIGSATDSLRIRIYQFDRVAKTLTQVATPDIIPGATVNSVNWSPDGKYLAAGIFPADTERIRIYQFDRANNTLIQVAIPNVIPGDIVYSVNWSPDGKYLAAGIEVFGDTERIRIYQFDRANNTLIQVAIPDIAPKDGVLSVNWSPDGKYLAGGIFSITDSLRIRIYQFDRATNSLTQVATPDIIPGASVNSINWSPDGAFIVSGIASVDSDRIKLYQALSFPEKNVIKNNTVYCNSGNQCPGGVGISGSSISNMIIGNTSFDNPFNYQFVTNVFNPIFGDEPTFLQNIAIDSNDPIPNRFDIPASLQRLELLAESLIDNLL